MKNLYITLLLFITVITSNAQNKKYFKAYLYNEEYKVFLKINFYDNNITIPGNEIFGAILGYFGDTKDGRKWLITSTQIKSPKHAILFFTNDYGSEDLKASLTIENDTTYILKQEEGSSIKIARNRKWHKIPSKLIFKPK